MSCVKGDFMDLPSSESLKVEQTIKSLALRNVKNFMTKKDLKRIAKSNLTGGKSKNEKKKVYKFYVIHKIYCTVKQLT